MQESCDSRREREFDKVRREALAFAGIGLYRYRLDGTVVMLDPGAFRLFELDKVFRDPCEAEGKPLPELISYTGPGEWMSKDLLLRQCVRDREWSFRTLQGREKWVTEDCYLVRDADTGEKAIQVIARDITDRKQTEAALAASEQRFREMLDIIPLIAVQLDFHARITFCNEYLCMLTGWRREELLGQDWFEIFTPPETQDESRAILLHMKNPAADIPKHFENTLLTRRGERRPILWSNMLPPDTPPENADLTLIGQDITERKQTEEKLRHSLEVGERLRALAASMNSCHSFQCLLEPLTQTILEVCQVDGCGVYTVERGHAVLRYHQGFPSDFANQVSEISLSDPVAVCARNSIYPAEIGAALAKHVHGYKQYRIKWAYSCPIRLEQELLGFLIVISCSDTPPPEDRIRFLSMISLETTSLLNRLRAEDILRESEAQYRITLDTMTDAIHVIDRNCQIVLINRSFLEWMSIIGLDGSAVGKNLFDVFDFLPEKVRSEYEQVFATGQSFDSEESTTINDRRFITETHKIPISRRGAVHHVLTIVQNVTERREAEKALVESEEKFRTLVEMFPCGLAISRDGRVAFANEAVRIMFRYEPTENFIGQDIMGVIAPDEQERLQEYVRNRSQEESSAPQHYETFLIRKDGEKFPAEVYIRPIIYQGLPSHQVLVTDISERKRAEEALRRSEERYRSILENMQEGYYEVNLRGDLTFFNAAMCKFIGYAPEELMGMNYSRYYPDEASIKKARTTFEQVYLQRQALQLSDWRIVRKDGKIAIWEVSVSLKYDDKGNIDGFRGVVRDVTDRKEAEQALQKAEAQYRELFENANDIIYTHDLSGHLTSLNKAGERISGYSREEALRMNVLDVVVPKYREMAGEMVRRKMLREDPTRYESAILAKDGRIIPVEVSTRIILENGHPVGVQGIARDITERKQAEEERKRLEAQIQHTQKLEGLGVLAGGIAHDFNNLLVGVLGNAGLALSRMPEASPARVYVRRIEETAQRAAELTNQMLAYSGRGTFLVRPVSLSHLAQEMGPLLTASISKKASLRYDCASDLPLIRGDVAQLHQILINLITNASDALGDRNGAITISTNVTYVDKNYLKKAYIADNLEDGPYACLAVSDTGCGMDAETLSRIFDPFFSTKFAGRGLGLAAVLGIVRSHHGTITVYTELGQGTTFKVLFPVAKGHDKGGVKEEPSPAEDTLEEWHGNEAILVADDEEAVLKVAKAALTQQGFKVYTAANGQEALDVFRKHPREIAAVLLDLTMPVMSGQEAFSAIRQIDASVPIILSSGYTEQDAAGRIESGTPDGFVQKPYRPRDLLRVLRKTLGK